MDILNDKQKAALFYHVFGGCKDRDLLFQIAEGENRYNRLKDSSKRQTVSVWYNSQIIQDGIKEFTYQLEKQKRIYRDEIIKGLQTETTNSTTETTINQTNFLDRDEFLQFLNERANQIQDDKLRNDILKMLSDNLRYKDSDNDQNSEIQRFYTPQTCENCPIYIKCSSCNLSGCPEMGCKC